MIIFFPSYFEQVAKNGQEDDVRQILSLPSPELDARDDAGYTAVHYAAEFNHIKILKLLLEAKACELFVNECTYM